MHLSPDVHAQIAHDRHQARLREAADHRLVRRTRPCSTIAHFVRRAAAFLGAATISPDGCGGRREPRVADSR
jgi:hypothetical protein